MTMLSFLKRRLLPRTLRKRWQHVRAQMAYRNLTSVERAVEWIRANHIPGSGIAPFPGNPTATQEVTGYIIPTLRALGERELACDLARWEASVQRPDGAVSALDGVPYTFDTAQVIRGFLSVLDDLPELEDNLRRACDYVEAHIAPDGRVLHESYDTWKLQGAEMLSEYGNLYVLPPMLQAGQKLGEPRYGAAAQRGLEYFRRQPDLMEFKPSMSMITHYLGYMTEACAEMGAIDLAEEGLRQAQALQRKDGSIPAYPGVEWVCSTGLAQLALAWYRTGHPEPADRALAYMETLQNPTGGFYGSYGQGARYFPNQEIAWAAKFYLDASQWHLRATFDCVITSSWEQIDRADGRVEAVVRGLGNLAGKSVLDIGCGRGRYLRVLQERYPSAILHGLDVSDAALAHCPPGVQTRWGTMLNLPYPDQTFDAILAVEALEHAVLVENSLREMARVLKPGGRIVIIDKSIAKLGWLKLMPWEKWFKPGDVQAMLGRNGVQTHWRPIPYQGQPADGLFIVWEGVKGSYQPTEPAVQTPASAADKGTADVCH